MRVLLQKGVKERSYSKLDYVPVYAPDGKSKHARWFLEEDSERSKSGTEGPRILKRAEFRVERERERLQKQLGRNWRKMLTGPDDLVSAEGARPKNKSDAGRNQSLTDNVSRSKTAAD